MRIYFKKEPEKKSKLFRFGKKYNADYIEDNILVWKIPIQHGYCKIAVALGNDGYTKIGEINVECDNFESIVSNSFYPKEIKWIGEMYEVIKNWKTFK